MHSAAFWSRYKLLACKVQACADSKIYLKFWGLKVMQQSLLLLFAFSPPIFFRFSCLIFFSSAVHLVGFILVGNILSKDFRILGLDDRKGRWVGEQDFHGSFQVNVTCFFAFFSGVLDWIVLILVWFERFFHSAQFRGQSCHWPVKLMTLQAVEGMWICTGSYGQFRDEWVKLLHLFTRLGQQEKFHICFY